MLLEIRDGLVVLVINVLDVGRVKDTPLGKDKGDLKVRESWTFCAKGRVDQHQTALWVSVKASVGAAHHLPQLSAQEMLPVVENIAVDPGEPFLLEGSFFSWS